MKTYVDIKDSTLERLGSSDVSKVINELLDGYLDYGPTNFTNLQLWRKFIELKLAQLQTDLDQHRAGCKCEATSIILDSNVNNRLIGKKTPLDVNEYQGLVQTEIKPTKKNKQETNIQIPMVENIMDIPL
jgi:hypothetical protein